MHNGWVNKKVLIIVKTYPNSSTKYQETVCTAGITEDGEWIRLYPINFRGLENNKKYKKYTWISTRMKPAKETVDGKRIDSFNPDMDSFKILNHLDSKKDIFERKSIILPTVSPSIEFLKKRFESEKKSLGIIKPKKVLGFDIVKIEPKKKQGAVQLDLFSDVPEELENIPYEFRYRFLCDDPSCNGHDMIILDWEIYEAYRKWMDQYSDEDATLEAIKRKWFDIICASDKDTHFILGTHNRFNTFMIIGVFWPVKAPYMDTLF